MMKFIYISIALLLTAAGSQEVQAKTRKFNMPDIPGYKTLVADLHSHTIYSDGRVMPSVRVDEAHIEGVDVVAVTEHIEDYCRKVPETKDADLNTSYNLYIEAAKGSNLIVIRGGEISRGMPPGHLNALFLTDVNPLDTEHNDQGIWKAVETAIAQGAFIVWNHPGWKDQAPDSTVWHDFHTQLHSRGYLHGIEVSNSTDGLYPETLEWYSKYNLAPISGSDTHGVSAYEFDLEASHKPVTLVFAKERTLDGVKQAMFDRRTLAYEGNYLYGNKQLLGQFFEASVQVAPLTASKKNNTWVMSNSSDIDYTLHVMSCPNGVQSPNVISLPAHSKTEITLTSAKTLTKPTVIEFRCENLVWARQSELSVEITFKP